MAPQYPMDEKPGTFNNPRYRFHKKNEVELLDDFVYKWYFRGELNRFVIKKGYKCDGASIPLWATLITRILPWFDTIYPFGQHLQAAFPHDKIWEYRGLLPEGIHMRLDRHTGEWVDAAYDPDGNPVWTMKTSNKFFARHLRELEVGKKERRAMFLAVDSFFGWLNWRSGKLPDDARPKKLPA